MPALIATFAWFGLGDTVRSAVPTAVRVCVPLLLWLRYTHRRPPTRTGRCAWALLAAAVTTTLMLSPLFFWVGPVLAVLVSEMLRVLLLSASGARRTAGGRLRRPQLAHTAGEERSAVTAPTPRSHQLAALDAIETALQTRDRTQVLMACGTGKTLVGRWLAERRAAQTTLVVVPSLALIAQTLTEWRAAGGWLFEALIICSDPTTAAGEQERVGTDGESIPAPFWARHRAQVTTSPRRASAVLTGRHPAWPLVVFSTNHSAPAAAAAARAAGTRFDLFIATKPTTSPGIRAPSSARSCPRICRRTCGSS